MNFSSEERDVDGDREDMVIFELIETELQADERSELMDELSDEFTDRFVVVFELAELERE